ncbi:MAG: hypothetical protein H6850_02630 [Alphaproteobacteria bacterium]|nr:MAG: hypothetical protein H6850_02630 [Alphaproteobacteria bacterium]
MSESEVKIDFHGKDVTAKYLDWYQKAKVEGFHGVPGWVIQMDDVFHSELKGDLENFGPVYAFTQSVSSLSKGSVGAHEDESAIKFSKALIVVPANKAYTRILDKESKRTRIEHVTIRKLKSVGDDISVQKEFSYYNAYIDHTEIIGGKEIAIVFRFNKLRVTENVFDATGAKSGLVSYEVEVHSGKVSA